MAATAKDLIELLAVSADAAEELGLRGLAMRLRTYSRNPGQENEYLENTHSHGRSPRTQLVENDVVEIFDALNLAEQQYNIDSHTMSDAGQPGLSRAFDRRIQRCIAIREVLEGATKIVVYLDPDEY